jgi:hypothetical protein
MNEGSTEMGKMGVGYGSEFHLLRYLGYQPMPRETRQGSLGEGVRDLPENAGGKSFTAR